MFMLKYQRIQQEALCHGISVDIFKNGLRYKVWNLTTDHNEFTPESKGDGTILKPLNMANTRISMLLNNLPGHIRT